jgi:hypothetical protein
MRAFVIALCLAAGVMVATDAVAQQSKGKARQGEAAAAPERRDERPAYRARGASAESEMDRIRAESCDPSGRYSDYPAWARAAFTCGSPR